MPATRPSGHPDEASILNAIWGLPALFALGAVVVVAGAVWTMPTSQLIHEYSDAGRRHLQASNYVSAMGCYQRLAQLGVDDQELRYRLALTEFGLGRHDRAVKMMAELASIERPGYVPAHVWWARRYLVVSSEAQSLEALSYAEQHLRWALQQKTESLEAHALLGQLCIASNRGAEAIQHLRLVVDVYPELRLQLARAYQLAGRKLLAESEARSAMSHFRQLLDSHKDNHAARLECARIAQFLEDFPQATSLLREGLARSNIPAFRSALAAAFASWATFLGQQPAEESSELLQTIVEGLRYDATHEGLLHSLLAFAQRNQEATDRALAASQSIMADGARGPALPLLLALHAHRQGQLAEARAYYEQAHHSAPNVSVVSNNLAWLLAHNEPVDLPRALQLIDDAVSRWPHNVDYRDTRGHVLMRMERWNEALAELEVVLHARPGDPNLRLALADVYDHLGMHELANLERNAVQRP
jgi:tetratricopeptide (TPR) repeat protein